MMSPSDDSPAAFCALGQRRRRSTEHAVLDRRGDLAVLVDQRSDVGRRGLRVPPDDDVVDGCSDDVLGPPVDRQVDVGDQPADGRRTGDHDPRAGEVRAVERPVGVARDDEVDLAVEALDHINDRARRVPARVDGRLVQRLTGRAALVEQDDDRLDAFPLEERHQRVDRVRLVVEVEIGCRLGSDDGGGALQRHADDGDFDPGEVLDRVWREDRVPGVLVRDVGSEELEIGALEPIAGEAPLDGVAAALLHACQLVGAFVELVVADAVVVEAHQVHRLDRRLVVEDGRDQGSGTDEVTGGHEHRVRVRGSQVAYVARQVFGTARWRGADAAAGAHRVGRPELTVEVVQGQHLDLGVACPRIIWSRWPRRSPCHRGQGGHARHSEGCDCSQLPALHTKCLPRLPARRTPDGATAPP